MPRIAKPTLEIDGEKSKSSLPYYIIHVHGHDAFLIEYDQLKTHVVAPCLQTYKSQS